jgi:ribosomal protein S18 acetylase RimI-like enzyme
MTALRLRPYRPEDEAAVVALWQACHLAVPQNDPRRDIARKLRVNPEWLLVGERDGTIVATCMVGYEGHRGWVNYLAVAPAWQRGGYGRQMMAEAERLLRQAGCAKINLQVRASNVAVVQFYRRLNFKVDDVVSMGKRLEPDQPPS